ncbi:unnamed protein product [Rotaria magnacalcarata]|uniref:Uncharacterized protein n=4 Tax=Rotaria magnacalcarata TaxID=392030 RepID=A0A8S2RPG2_9BILA|nr:unnamed protein product [Rotaria magnacalcarata]CAF4654394.1 unnamed protein product [Rotaria magnacalcarata]
MYTFIGIDEFGETDLRNIEGTQKLLLCNQLKSSSVPVIFIVNNCERDNDVQQWAHRNRKLLDKHILLFEDICYLWRKERLSKSLEEIWKAIEKYALNQEKVLALENSISATSNERPATSKTSLPAVENAAAANAKCTSPAGNTLLCN